MSFDTWISAHLNRLLAHHTSVHPQVCTCTCRRTRTTVCTCTVHTRAALSLLDTILVHKPCTPMTPPSMQRCRSGTCQQHTIRTKAHSRPTGTDPPHNPRTHGSMTPLALPSDTDPQHTSARRGTHDPTYASAPQTCTGPPDTQTSAWSSPDPTTHLELSSPTRFRGTLSPVKCGQHSSTRGLTDPGTSIPCRLRDLRCRTVTHRQVSCRSDAGGDPPWLWT